MQNRTLPSHRELITSLITSIAREHNPSDPSSRALLLTLHVIFPALVLPALDLLDRNLITRLALSHARPSPRQDDQPPADPDPAGPEAQGPFRVVYAVQSAVSGSATSHRRREAALGPPRRRYLVHVDAWSCSCAAFALEAYRRAAAWAGRAEGESTSTSDGLDFGGLSLDGREDCGGSVDVEGGQGRGQVLEGDADVPCCKHLLACFLAEKWEGGLGARVETRTVAKEELAAMVAGL
ncbi:hypothetical protein ESCO_003713 [Escovopsis weberi]|uniref:SWIM-type domain-containing protein n=1 Tax=Escovopsis weberi TaxID=150374 RepID=A0A0M8NA14_ESCWE|nr:hypothetical protein ESCO_003713 [Escovopsis weberi]